MHQQNTQKDLKKKKISLAIGYIVSFALLGMVALDFMGYAIPIKPLIAHATTQIGLLQGSVDVFSCAHGSPSIHQFISGTGRANSYWYSCTQ